MPLTLCQMMIDRFEKHPETQSNQHQVTTTGLGLKHHKDEHSHRLCTETNLIRHGNVWGDLYDGLKEATHHAVKRYKQDCPTAVFPEEYGLEEFRLKRYDHTKDERFDYHVDVMSHKSAKRFLVLFWYLNTVEKGGETFFPIMNLKVKPVQGTLLMFPPMWMYPHAGLKPLSNTKYIVGTYLHYA